MKRLKLRTCIALIATGTGVVLFNSCTHGFSAIDLSSMASSLSSTPAAPTSPGATPTAPTPPPSVRRADGYNLGMNLPWITYWNNTPMYADAAMQMCGNNGPWDALTGGGPAPLDATGAPTVNASAAVTADYLTGRYTLSWDGTGSVTVHSGATIGTTTSTVSNGVQHNTATVTIVQNPSDAASLNQSTNFIVFYAYPPVTNIHLMAPTPLRDNTGFFMQYFLDKMRPFSTLRFKDPTNTDNNDTTKDWLQRSWPTAGGRCGKTGMAYEDIIAFANATGKDIWINVPALATDNYVCRLARLLRYGESGADDNGSNCSLTAPSTAPAGAVALNPNSKVYVELSNEIWNWGFQQTSDLYCMANGAPASYSCTQNGAPSTCYHTCDVTAPTSFIAQAALADSTLPWAPVGYARTEEMAMLLTKRDNDIFKTVFGSQASQIKTVINVQSAYPAEADGAFAFMKQAYGSVTSSMDYMAVAPYFSLDTDTSTTGSGCHDCSVDNVFNDLFNNILSLSDFTDNNSTGDWLTQDLAEANKYGLYMVAYEGGQGMLSSDATLNANIMTAQSDPRMYTATQQYLQLWDMLVGRQHLFMYFTFDGTNGKYGSWGSLINATDPGSQKWDTLMSDILIPGDANGDGVVDQNDCAIVKANLGKSDMWWSQGDFNHDGTVSPSDLTILNAHITGAPCTVQ